MKRDMELVRQILLAIEAYKDLKQDLKFEIEGYSEEQIMYHMKILADGGLIEAIDASTFEGICFIPQGLTWSGYEFLDAIRNETVWKQTKEVVRDKGGSLPFEVLKSLAIEFLKKFVGL